MTEPHLRGLPRSLDPLPDETLSGYLLRLAHRLCIDPGHLVRRTGLVSNRADGPKLFRVPMNPVFDLDDERKQLFAHTTRLSIGEVDSLLLAGLGNRYGPLNPMFLKSATTRVIHNNPWVLTETIRYCPECLTGDRSEIESLHGGAWRRSWRLPVVFACVQHSRFLRDRCPDCGGLVHSDNGNSMIARMNDHTLHPTQCRSTPTAPGNKTRSARPACGADLTDPGTNDFKKLSPQTRRAVISIQERLGSLLATDGPEHVGSVGWTVPVAQYFIDLRAVAALIFMTWPEARPHAATPTLAQMLDGEAQRRQLDFVDRWAARAKQGNAIRAYSDPPADPLVAAAVFEMADRFLRSPDESSASAVLGPLADEARYVNRRVSYNLRRAPGTSIPLQVVLLTRRRRAGIGDNITEIIEGHGGLTRF